MLKIMIGVHPERPPVEPMAAIGLSDAVWNLGKYAISRVVSQSSVLTKSYSGDVLAGLAETTAHTFRPPISRRSIP